MGLWVGFTHHPPPDHNSRNCTKGYRSLALQMTAAVTLRHAWEGSGRDMGQGTQLSGAKH